MKGKKFEKKLKLNKFTVANLPKFQMKRVKGGIPMCTDYCTDPCWETNEFPDCKEMNDHGGSTTLEWC